MTGVIADLIYAHLGQDKMLPDEQKGCKKGSLVQTVCVFSEDIVMEFGIENCAMLVLEKGKIVK